MFNFMLSVQFGKQPCPKISPINSHASYDFFYSEIPMSLSHESRTKNRTVRIIYISNKLWSYFKGSDRYNFFILSLCQF